MNPGPSHAIRLVGAAALMLLASGPPPAAAQVTSRQELREVALPDLVVSEIGFTFKRTFAAPDGSSCTDFQLQATYQNRGAGPTGKTAYYAIYRGRASGGRDQMAGSYAVAALAAGETLQSFPIDFCTCHFDIEGKVSRPDTNAFRVVIDYHRDIVESNESNNSRSRTFRVPMRHR